MDGLLNLIITIVVVGAIYYVVNRAPMPELLKAVIYAVSGVYVLVLGIKWLWRFL